KIRASSTHPCAAFPWMIILPAENLAKACSFWAISTGGSMMEAKGTELAWWQRGVVYQIYPRSFQDSNDDGIGDLQGVIRRLDYLNWLGITSVWISPVYPSPMADFGYDISDYEDIDPIFGSLDDF